MTSSLAWSIDCLASVPAKRSPDTWGKPAQVAERSLANYNAPAEPLPSGAILRRWEAGFTDRLNEAHWAHAHGAPINHDLAIDLPRLRARTAWEMSNNPIVDGMITTHCQDLVGPAGPILQVYSSDDRFASRLESRWAEWAEICEASGDTLVDLLKLWFRSLWATGELLGQVVTDEDSPFPATMRILPLHADRLATPHNMIAAADVALGVRRSKNGRPLSYFISDLTYTGPWQQLTGKFDEKAARFIHHGFFKVEPGQVRGFPLLASALPAIADIRDYDTQVLDAARAAADTGVWFFNSNPDGEKWAGAEAIEVPTKRRVNRTAPPGWQPMQLQPGHPTANYSEHRRERMVEFGRAASIPLMMIRLDSSLHNYSSARFDHQVYVQGLSVWRAWIARKNLRRMVMDLVRELQLARDLGPMPADTRLAWGWQMPPHVDPSKERAAERIGLQNRTLTFEAACNAGSQSQEDVIASWAKTMRLLKDAGFDDAAIEAFLATLGFTDRSGTASVRSITSTQQGATR